mgnify:CR=1 FL=1|jgi:hypothetical protein|tara:strand:- start:9919 stop:10122 length:204 start_codon:yes stop_codon:yes gene_type:complete
MGAFLKDLEMLIKLLVSRAGVNFSQTAGDIVEVENAEALRMISAGQAEASKKETIVETATKKIKGKK